MNRLRTILTVVFEAGGSTIVERMKIKHLVPWRCRIRCFFAHRKHKNLMEDGSEGAMISPEVLRLVFEKLGPTFIKLGQVLSMRADLVGEEIAQELSKLQSDVPPFSYGEAKLIIAEEFDLPMEELFKSFEKKPVAAASLAQVHRARLQDGTEVAVKIQRPNIKKIIKQDIHILFSLAYLAEKFIPESRVYQPMRLVKEFADWTLRELDFKVEGNNAERMRFAFKENKHINIPVVYWDLTRRSVLTMDFIHGVKADDIVGIKKLEADPKQLALNGVGAIMQQFLIDGFFHADPHPGNFFAMKNNMLCLHDFGMVGYLSPIQRKELLSCLVAFTNKDIESFIKHFLHLAEVSEKSDFIGFQKDASEILSELFFSPNQPSVAWVFFHLINKGAKREIRFSSDLVLFGKAIITTEAMGLKLYPEFDFNKELQPFVEKAFKTYLDPRKSLQTLKTDIFDYMETLKSLPEKTQDLLKKIEGGKLSVKIDASELMGIKTEFDRQNDLRIFGIAVVAMFLVSLVFAYLEGKNNIGGISLSSIGLIISLILLGWLFLKILKKPNN